MRTRVWLGCVLLALTAANVSAAAGKKDANICKPAGGLVRLQGLPEASGLALRRGAAQQFWSLNDSGAPVLVSFDASGTATGKVTVTGARVDDWEDVTIGPCPGGTCLYVADIGDNNRARRSITIYRTPEPAAGATATAAADAITASYPDGAHDAEALFVTSPTELFIVTKGEPSVLYRLRLGAMPAAGAARLERVAAVDIPRVTGAAISPDGTWVALRSNNVLTFHRTRELTGGKTGGGIRVDLRGLKEPQGEGVAIAADGTVYLAGEGGAGTFVTLRCTLPR